MKLNDLMSKKMDMENKIEAFQSKYDIEELLVKKREYDQRKRGKSNHSSTQELMKTLKKANSCICRFQRLEKKLKDLQEDIQDLQCGCTNCHRRDPQGDNSCSAPYPLSFRKLPKNSIIKRRFFRFVQVDDASDELVLLCSECTEFLGNFDQKEGRSFENVWPSFVWSILVDRDMFVVYGDYVWRFVPEKWRHWWIESVMEYGMLESVTMDWTPPLFTDITEDIKHMKCALDKNTLTDIMNCCNTYLMPSVLCPWGEAEYIHQCGNLPYDTLLQRYLPKCYIQKVNSDKLCQKAFSTREDYFRDNEDYENLLLNPNWKVKPCVAFIEGKGPQVLTCREHHTGTNKQYVHTPRQPNHIIPSDRGDQLCHAVIKSRMIKQLRASKYCNIYQMCEQQGSYQGVDTCDVIDFGDFGFISILLDESESRSIKFRPDINSLLDFLEKLGLLDQLQYRDLEKGRVKY